ncbi:MAG TPA: hypothetical protein PK967_15975, partial [Candidatus Hydrogenedentes bacterium]|nr:hypothetical protein [Candidatus Hydrogenedentota bacterium]
RYYGFLQFFLTAMILDSTVNRQRFFRESVLGTLLRRDEEEVSPIHRIFGPLCHADSNLASLGPDIRVLFPLCVYLRHLWIV